MNGCACKEFHVGDLTCFVHLAIPTVLSTIVYDIVTTKQPLHWVETHVLEPYTQFQVIKSQNI